MMPPHKGTWLLDTNILVAFFDVTSTHHAAAVSLVSQTDRGSLRAMIAAQNVLELSSVLITGYKVKKSEVAADIQTLISHPNITIIYPNATAVNRYLQFLKDVPSVHTTDLLLAATMIAHGTSSIITNDRDFEKIPELTVYNPFRARPLKS